MTKRKFYTRMITFIALVLYLFVNMGWTLYSVQIVYGEQYAAQSQRKQGEEEWVEVARGQILDRYGRVLVSNQLSYEVVLDWTGLGSTAERGDTLAQVLSLAKGAGYQWDSSLNITQSEPYYYTVDNIFYGTYQNDAGEDYRVLTRYGEFCLRMKWIPDPRETEGVYLGAGQFLSNMVEQYELEAYSTQEQRDIIGVIYDLLLRYYSIRYDDYCFIDNADIDLITQIKERDFNGVEVEAVTQRVYGTEYAAHILGRVSSMNQEEWAYFDSLSSGYAVNDLVGKEGAEQAFESYLRGEHGIREIERNANGDILAAQWLQEPTAGQNIVLTMDIDLQKKVEDVLATGVPKMENTTIEGAACVLMEVNTGSVLAAASYPSFDLSLYSQEIQANLENPLNPLYNRAFQGTYAPGSTFKMVTGIASLEEGITNPSTTIRCDATFDYYEEHGPACWIYNQYRGTHGLQNISNAIKNSCNYYFYEAGLQLGIGEIRNYAHMFGLGEATGIELTERVGVMAGPEYTQATGGIWYDGATLSVAIGQESSVFTPLQLTNYIATLVNGGTHYDAHLLQEVKSGDFSQVVYQYDPEETAEDLELEQENMEAVKQGMRDLISSGSVSDDFQQLTNMGIYVGAKTGTAQLTSEASASANAVFVCFAPYDNPEVAMTIVVEKGGSGGEVASMAAEILDYYFTNQVNRDEIKRENTLQP